MAASVSGMVGCEYGGFALAATLRGACVVEVNDISREFVLVVSYAAWNGRLTELEESR